VPRSEPGQRAIADTPKGRRLPHRAQFPAKKKGPQTFNSPNCASGQLRILPKTGDFLACEQTPAERTEPQTFTR